MASSVDPFDDNCDDEIGASALASCNSPDESTHLLGWVSRSRARSLLRAAAHPPIGTCVDKRATMYRARASSPNLNADFDGGSFGDPFAHPATPPWRQRAARFARRWRAKAPYYVPVMTWLPRYQWRQHLIADVLAGVAVATLLVPQALAYALLAGLPPLVGLYTSFFPILVYAIMGHSKQLSVGPDALVSTLVGSVTHKVAAESGVLVAQVLSLLVGLFVLLLGLLRLGFLDVILSRPLLSGFINAVAVEIVVEQFDSLFGIKAAEGVHGLFKISYVFSHLNEIHKLTAVVGFLSLAVLLSLKVFKIYGKRRWPSITLLPDLLFVVGANIAFVYAFDLHKHGLETLGAVGSGFTAPSLPRVASLDLSVADVAQTTLVIGMIGFVESIAGAKSVAARHNVDVSPNRELVAYGLSNLVSSFFGAYPTFGSLTRTSVCDQAGASSQIFSLSAAAVVLSTIFWLGPVFSLMPRVVGSSIIVVAAIGLFEFHDFIFLWRLRAFSSIALFLFTFVSTVWAGVQTGIVLSLVVSLFLVLKRVSVPHISALGRLRAPDNSVHFKALENYPNASTIPSVAILRLGDPLFFANINSVRSLLRRVERHGALHAHPSENQQHTQIKAVILHMDRVPSIDPSALATLAEIAADYRARGISFLFVKVGDKIKRLFIAAGIITSLGGTCVFPSTEMAVESVQGRLSRLYSSHHRTYLYGDDQAEDQPATEETIENKKEKDVEEGLEN